ncbi:MAG: 2'-5' RNA ligase family protein [Comamonadaceae bacterium]|nr:MAG: 2'-5' RNA ligase family protein [Comamonadaceae bacterium]
MDSTPTPLILTLQMEAASAATFTQLRRRHFPPARNWLDAHITLFNALPSRAFDEVLQDVAELAAQTRAFSMRVERVRFLGAGVAFDLASPDALVLRRTLAERWGHMLGRQDLQWRGPLHVTVQNKVRPEVARALHSELTRDFEPRDLDATGLELWRYLGGPWQAVGTWGFEKTV